MNSIDISDDSLLSKRGVNHLIHASRRDQSGLLLVINVDCGRIVRILRIREEQHLVTVGEYALVDLTSEVQFLSLSPKDSLLLVTTSKHELLFIKFGTTSTYCSRTMDLTAYSRSSVRSIEWMSSISGEEVAILMFSHGFLCINTQSENIGNSVCFKSISIGRSIDHALSPRPISNAFYLITGTEITRVDDPFGYKEVPKLNISSVKEVLVVAAVGETFLIGYYDSSSSLLTPTSTSKWHLPPKSGFKHATADTSIRDAFHVPPIHEEADSKLLLPSETFANPGLIEEIGSLSIPRLSGELNNRKGRVLIQDLSLTSTDDGGDCLERSITNTGISLEEEHRPQMSGVIDQAYFIVQSLNLKEKTCYILDDSSPADCPGILRADLMQYWSLGDNKFLVALGSGIDDIVKVYRLYKGIAKCVRVVKLKGGKCKGLIFMPTNDGPNVELKLIILVGRKEKDAKDIVSVALREVMTTSLMYININVKELEVDSEERGQNEVDQSQSTDIHQLLELIMSMKDSFECRLSRIERSLEIQIEAIQCLDHKVEVLRNEKVETLPQNIRGDKDKRYVGHVIEGKQAFIIK